MLNLTQEAIKLLRSLKDGYMRGLAYDTAWAAMVPENKHSKKPLFSKSLLEVITGQNPDGSWGAEVDYYHDRLISTLASIVSLKKTHKADKFKDRIESGEDYIWYNISRLRTEPQETVGFELLFPSLMNEANNLGLNLPYREKYYEPIKEKKMNMAIAQMIASNDTTITYSLEFLGDYATENILLKAQNINGSISNSPAATAFMLTKMHDKNALNYVNTVLNFNGGSAMTLYPFDIFETGWVIDYFMKSDLPIKKHFLEKVEDLGKLWSKAGISMSQLYSFRDLDDTTTVFNILNKTNHKLDPSVFEEYESDEYFNCYPLERSPSPLVNIKVLSVLNNIKGYARRDEVIDKILKFLYKTREDDGYWLDKWNVSPYYCTGLALEAIGDLDDSMSGPALEWMINTQNDDGSWGQKVSNMEETAYSVLALLHHHLNIEKIDSSIINNGLRYLEKHFQTNYYPELWIGKGLYCPENVAKASVIAALYLGKSLKN